MSPCDSELRNPVDDVNRQIETIDLVLDGKLERRIDIAVFLVAANMEVVVIGATVSKFVNQPGVAMEVENDRFVYGEQAVKVTV